MRAVRELISMVRSQHDMSHDGDVYAARSCDVCRVITMAQSELKAAAIFILNSKDWQVVKYEVMS